MADAPITSGNSSGKHRKHPRRQMPQVDMTPMVDLGFLLITFFMLSMEMNHAKAMEWDKRIAESQGEPVPDCCVLNVLIDSADRVFTYKGLEVKNLEQTSFNRTGGIEQIIMNESKRVKNECGLYLNGKPHQLITLVKLLPGASYKNLVDIMDDLQYLNPGPYSIQDPQAIETEAVQAKEMALLAKR